MKDHYYNTTHSRNFDNFTYVYPVISRRSKGLSLGINLNPDKICNFGCIYCQVNRNQMSKHVVDMEVLKDELQHILFLIENQSIFKHPRFEKVSEDKLIFKDIAIAGDGEPSVSKYLLETIEIILNLSKTYKIPKVVIISNTTGFERERTLLAFEKLSEINGEIWAKLDAGTQNYFRLINQHHSQLNKVISNIQNLTPKLNLKIQSCFMKVKGENPSIKEVLEFKERIKEIQTKRKIDALQIYTIARKPKENYVQAISLKDLKLLFKPLHELNLKIEYYSGTAN